MSALGPSHQIKLVEPKSSIESTLLFFVIHTAPYGAELWLSDGTPQGTRIVRDIYPGPASSSPSDLTILDGRLYFIAEMPDEGRVVFSSDGMPENTYPLLINQHSFTWPPLNTSSLAANALGLVTVSNMPPRAGVIGPTLLLIRPTGGCSSLLELPDDSDLWAKDLTVTPKCIFFTYQNSQYGDELWMSDGTRENTRMVKDIYSLP